MHFISITLTFVLYIPSYSCYDINFAFDTAHALTVHKSHRILKFHPKPVVSRQTEYSIIYPTGSIFFLFKLNRFLCYEQRCEPKFSISQNSATDQFSIKMIFLKQPLTLGQL